MTNQQVSLETLEGEFKYLWPAVSSALEQKNIVDAKKTLLVGLGSITSTTLHLEEPEEQLEKIKCVHSEYKKAVDCLIEHFTECTSCKKVHLDVRERLTRTQMTEKLLLIIYNIQEDELYSLDDVTKDIVEVLKHFDLIS
ncbi:hypothetical protein [Alkalihalobacillus sp. LMS39]|uniref:hypothetical protein n=1 Tax=Alkalihalobacillus sp. LMS39 TaxID=2924032 RepID=UPI001FB33718|nr:hypothetical protein [Alkalihalobacillus sp. LMS39]UOE96049.1 hypothetical protein MM271_10810 [Alkalihalobacillus sp. LMS39]